MILFALKNGWTGGQYCVFRALLGMYLIVHFLHLMPWSTEVFSNIGMITPGTLSPFMHIFPNIFLLNDSPLFIHAVLLFSAIASFLFMIGIKDKLAAVWLIYILACLFGRNPLIANPALPYLGFMLLAHVFIPASPYHSRTWVMPKDVFTALWVILALSYSYSGYTKVLSPSWLEGNNIIYVLNNPLARDYFLRDFFLWIPPIFLQLLTWSVLFIELFFAPLAIFSALRPILWGLMALIQLGFACLLNFFDLTSVMLLFHLITFDPAWVPGKNIGKRPILFYDGQCGLCHGVIKFLLAEDKRAHILFSPLQSDLFVKTLPEKTRQTLPDTIVLVLEDGSFYTQSSAVAMLLMYLGGLWRPIGLLLMCIPRFIRNAGYTFVGSVRTRLFQQPSSLCPMVEPDLKGRFLS